MAEISNDIIPLSKAAILALLSIYIVSTVTLLNLLLGLWKAIFSRACKSQAVYCIFTCCFAIAYLTILWVFFCDDWTLVRGIILITSSIVLNLGLISLQLSIWFNANVLSSAPLAFIGAGVLQVIIKNPDGVSIDPLCASLALVLGLFGIFGFGMASFWSPASRRSLAVVFLCYLVMIPMFMLLRFSPPSFPQEAIPLIFCVFVTCTWCLAVLAILGWRRWACVICTLIYLIYTFLLILWYQQFNPFMFMGTWLLCTLVVVTVLSIILRTCKASVIQYEDLVPCLRGFHSPTLRSTVDGINDNSRPGGGHGPPYDDIESMGPLGTEDSLSHHSSLSSPYSNGFPSCPSGPALTLQDLLFGGEGEESGYYPRDPVLHQPPPSDRGGGYELPTDEGPEPDGNPENGPTENEHHSSNSFGCSSYLPGGSRSSSHVPVQEQNESGEPWQETTV